MKVAQSSYTLSPINYIQSDKWNCLIMPAYQEGDAFSLLENNEQNEQNTKQIVYDVIQGLIHLKSLNVIHNDIKPENILLIRDKKTIHGIIADFGFAEILTKDEILIKFLVEQYFMHLLKD